MATVVLSTLRNRLPGARTSCALLTLLTLLLAWPEPAPGFAAAVKTAYFAHLSWFFLRTRKASPALHSQPMRLICGGFFVLFLGYAVATSIYFLGLEAKYTAAVYMRLACEHGAWFLLGTTLISYGVMLCIPEVIKSNQLLSEHSEQQQHELQRSKTERTELEQRLVISDRLAMLGELAATIAHDLRNPLTIVKGTAESLCRKERTEQEIAEHTKVIQRNIDKADNAIANLINLAKQQRNDPVDTKAIAALDEVQDMLRVEAHRRAVMLVVKPTDRSSSLLQVDRTLLAQALMNLVLNALQASQAHGIVTLQARHFRHNIALVVSDRGCGLPDDIKAGMLKPFFTTKPAGTGLGLISCRRIATELGGQLRHYSRRRGGARAIIWLPAKDSSQTREPDIKEQLQCPANSC